MHRCRKAITILITLLFISLNITVYTSADSAGPNSPDYAINDNTVGSTEWQYPGYVFQSDNKYAYVETKSSTISYYLFTEKYGFDIPSSATITGIKVEVEKYGRLKPPDYAVDYSVRLLKGGVLVGDDKADTSTHWPSSDTYVAYGGENDLWGTTWTPDDINNIKFGVAISVDIHASEGGEAAIDHVRITVYYSTGGPNNSPTISDESPANGSTNVAVSEAGVVCSVYVGDQDGDTLTITWATNASTGEWHNVATEIVSANTTVSHTFSEFYQYDQTYWWRVYADDGTVNVSETYHFHTEGETHTTDWFDPASYGSQYNEWYSPQNALADDDTYSLAVSSDSAHDEEDYYVFDIDVPDYATIKGIEVCFNGRVKAALPTPDDSRLSVKLSWDGGNTWSESRIIQFTPTDDDAFAGGSADLWGHNWIPQEFTNSNFKLYAKAIVNSSGEDAASEVDYIKMRITYSISSNQAPTISNPNPANGSIDVPVSPSGVTCSAYFADQDGDNLDISWYYSFDGSTWYHDGTDTNKPPNATYSHTYSQFTETGVTYYWRVYANDGTANTSSDIWHFRTSAPHLYVIVNDTDYNLAVQYKTWKEANSEYTVIITKLSEIENDPDYWATGTWGDRNPSNPFYVEQSSWTAADGYNDTACKVRNFIRDKYTNDPSLAAVLIFGKDPHRMGYWTLTDPGDAYPPGHTIDLWYFGALNGTQNKNDNEYFCEVPGTDDFTDFTVEVVIGRFPYGNEEEFWYMFNKTKAYIADTSSSQWQNFLFFDRSLDTNTAEDDIWVNKLDFTYFNILDNVGALHCPSSAGLDHTISDSVHDSYEFIQYLNGTHPDYEDGLSFFINEGHGGEWWDGAPGTPDDGYFDYEGAEEKAFVGISIGCGDNVWLSFPTYYESMAKLIFKRGGAVITIGTTGTHYDDDLVFRFIDALYSTNWTYGDALKYIVNHGYEPYHDSGICLLGDPTLKPKNTKYTNIKIYGPTMRNNTYSIPGHPYTEFKFIDLQGDDIDSASLYFYDGGSWHLAKTFSDDEVENLGEYSYLYSGCDSPDTVYRIKIICTANGITSTANMRFQTHPYDDWTIFYIEKNDTDQLQPQIHGKLNSLSHAYYYKYEGLINGEYKTLEEGVSPAEQSCITITNTTFMNNYGNYTIRCTFSSTGVTRTEIFVKTIRASYQTPDLTLLPNDNGTVNDDDITANGAAYKWQCIDDGPSHDGDSTYIEGGVGEETFNFENTTSNLKYLKIIITSKATDEILNHLYITLKFNGQLTRIAKIDVDNTNYQTFVIHITRNPFTNENWTANDLSNLEVGLYFEPATAIPSPKIRCTSLYIEGAIKNSPPTLSNPSVTPSSGVADYTVFYFNITYSDPDGNPPAEIKVNISKTGWYINVTMTYVSGDNTTGALYSYSTTLSAGVYDYLFYASDGEASTINDPTDQVTVEEVDVSIDITPGSYDWGFLEPNEEKHTSDGYFTVTNTGNVPIDVTIRGTNATDEYGNVKWTLIESSAPGFNEYAMQYSTDLGDTWEFFNWSTSPVKIIYTNLPPGGSIYVDLKIIAPASTDYYQQVYFDIYFGAVQSS